MVRRLISVTGLTVGGAVALAGLGYYLVHNYDPARVVYKRWKAPTKYVYEEIAPRFLRTDPAGLINLPSRWDAARARSALSRAIWGDDGLPRDRLPAAVERGYLLAGLRDLSGLGRVDRLSIPVGETYVAYAYHLAPVRPSGGVVIYQHGYAGTVADMAPLFEALLDRGYAVIALNNFNYGENRTKEKRFPRFGWYYPRLWDFLNLLEHPLRVYFQPIAVSVNYATTTLGAAFVDMVGFSNGGWQTMVAAAMDPRIRRSYPVAGAYPIYLRSGETKVNQPEHFYRPMLMAATYPDMFTLAALEPHRRQLQIFNRYDRCCWRNVKARHYEDAVKKAVRTLGGGQFSVLIDETHADHKLSAFARDAIIADLGRP